MSQTDNLVVTEMAAVHLFHTMDNVTCIVTGQQYASLLEKFIVPGKRCKATTVLKQDDAPPQ